MNYPKWNLITGLLIIIGIHPLVTHRTLHWYRKIHSIGIWLCGLQIIFSVYTFHKELKQTFYSLYSNNIMEGAMVTKRIIGIGFPLITIAGIFLKRDSTEEFFGRIDRLEVFLQSTIFVGDIQKLNYKMQRVNFLSGFFVIVLEFITVVIGAGTNRAQGQGRSRFDTFLFFHSSILIHIAVTQNIYVKFYGVALHQDMFSAFVEKILETTQATRISAKSYRKQCLNRVVQQRLYKRV